MTISPEQLYAEVDDIIRCMPDRAILSHPTEENEAWLGRAAACVSLWRPHEGIVFKGHVDSFGTRGRDTIAARQAILTTLQQMKNTLRLSTSGPLTVAVEATRVFEYFDEMRKIIEASGSDLFFVDPYLDAEFVSRYLPHVRPGVTVRLLGSKGIDALASAIAVFKTQENMDIRLRKSSTLHDRYVFSNRAECYQSGASFKDGAKKSGTTITQISDAFPAMSSTYEALWNTATVINIG